MYIYVCIYMCVCVYIYIYIYMCIYVYILDRAFNVSTKKYEPYNKPDNEPLYIDVNYINHQINVNKNFPNSISNE